MLYIVFDILILHKYPSPHFTYHLFTSHLYILKCVRYVNFCLTLVLYIQAKIKFLNSITHYKVHIKQNNHTKQ